MNQRPEYKQDLLALQELYFELTRRYFEQDEEDLEFEINYLDDPSQIKIILNTWLQKDLTGNLRGIIDRGLNELVSMEKDLHTLEEL